MSRYDAVLSYHLNPLTCGTGKFNHQLAKRLGVPCRAVGTIGFKFPLVSLKPDEILTIPVIGSRRYDLLLHSELNSHWGWQDALGLISGADRVLWAADIGIPPTIVGNPTSGAYKVLTYGMAHKRVIHHFEKLKAQLETEHHDYTISLSTAVHEGNPWDAAMLESEASLRELFGERFRFLGFLADDALARELQECDAVAAYFTPALRANNTSAWAAIAAGKTLYTNRDEFSPPIDAPVPTWDALLKALHA